MKLDELKARQEERVSAAIAEKSRTHMESQEINKKLEKKVQLLELALQQFEDKSKLAKTEMATIKDTIMQDSDVKLTAAQQRYMAKLEDSMKKLEKNAKKTKKELDGAIEELEAMKIKEMETAQMLAQVENQKFKSVEEFVFVSPAPCETAANLSSLYRYVKCIFVRNNLNRSCCYI